MIIVIIKGTPDIKRTVFILDLKLGGMCTLGPLGFVGLAEQYVKSVPS